FNVEVEVDLEYLNESLAGIDRLAHVEANSVRGHIVLSGTVSNAENAIRMVEMASLFLPVGSDGKPQTTVHNHLDVAGEQQVMINCTVAEVSRSALRQLGINGFLAGDNFKDGFAVNQIGGINPIDIGAAGDALVTENLPFVTGPNGIPLSASPTLSLGFPRVQTQVFIKAMADNTLLSVLAEPTLMAISGETATFLAGGEFPVPVPQGNQQVTIEWKEFGVRLNFTPVVKGGQMIRLRVAPEISEVDNTTGLQIEGFVVPGLNTRATETTVELGAGQSLALSGLLNETSRGLSSRIPGIGDVPVLGALFRSVEFQRSLTELVVMVTPQIVAPLDTHQRLRLPTDGREDPDEVELYLLGLLDSLDTTPGREKDEEGDDVSAYRPVALQSQPEVSSVHGPWGLVAAASNK
ncbi:MAG: type II and III secretion system protein family protein, partial [Planctomycetota bacterium]